MDLNKDRVRTAYNEAVAKIDAKRNGLLSGILYKQMQELVFETAYAALLDTASPPTQPRMHVLSALPGTGKSTFSNSFAAAIVACGGSVLFVVEQMETVDQRYRDLDEILPGQVACWSTDHRKGNRSPSKVKNPAAQFDKTELRRYPVAVCTHEGYKKDEASLFRNWRHGGRTFIIIDEMVKEVTQYAVDIEAVARAVKLANQDEDAPPEALTALDKLHSFLVARTQQRTPIDTLSDQAVQELATAIAWFTTVDAERYAEGKEVLPSVFGFAKCLSRGWAFICTDGGVTTLTGYDNNLPIMHGTLQLDGTAAICGVKQLDLDDRVVLPGPLVSFGGLRTVIEKPPTRMHLAKYLTKADNLLTYRNWMIEVIKRHAHPGQKVLVVCKKALTGPEGLKYFPAWEHSDRRWRDVNYATAFGYDLDGGGAEGSDPINVSVQWWGGPSTGHNAWQEADAVFLFDANWAPRHKVLGDMQGLRRQAAGDANSPIAEMGGSLRRQSDRFRDYKLRCMMRDHVQAACRGRLRRWDHLALYARVTGVPKDAARAATAGPADQAGTALLGPSGSLTSPDGAEGSAFGLEAEAADKLIGGVDGRAFPVAASRQAYGGREPGNGSEVRRRASRSAGAPMLIIPECGQQLLVCGIHEDAWLWENWKEMFPGAPLPTHTAQRPQGARGGYKQDWAERLRDLLSQPNLPERVSTRWIGEQWAVEWRKVSKEALKALPSLAGRWKYEPGRGRAPSCFAMV